MRRGSPVEARRQATIPESAAPSSDFVAGDVLLRESELELGAEHADDAEGIAGERDSGSEDARITAETRLEEATTAPTGPRPDLGASGRARRWQRRKPPCSYAVRL